MPSSGDRYLGVDPVALLALAGTTELASLALHRSFNEIRHALADAAMAAEFPSLLLTVEHWLADAQADLFRRAADLVASQVTPKNIGHAINWFARHASRWPAAAPILHRLEELAPPAVGMLIDVDRLVHPAHHGLRGEVDRAVAGVGLAAGATTLAATAGILGPELAVIAGTVEAGAAAYQTANFLYDHRKGLGSVARHVL